MWHWLWDQLEGRGQKGFEETVNEVGRRVITMLLDTGEKATPVK